jgi:hypothetical protein
MSDHQCDCKAQGPALMPVRYAVVPDSISENLPAWAAPLAEDYPQRQGYHYALRALRRGFIYIYYSWSSSWEAWSVCDDGSLWKQLSAENALPKSKPDCLQGTYGQGGKDFITLPAQVLENDIWIAFTQCKWTKATLDRYGENEEVRQRRMQRLRASQWRMSGQMAGAGEATEESLSSVLDYVPGQGDMLSPAMMLPCEGPVAPVSYTERNCYHLSEETLPQWQRWLDSLMGDSHKERCAIQPQWTLYPWRTNRKADNTLQQMRQRGVKPDGTPVMPLIMALHDATGITHELTGWANGILALQQKFAEERAVEFSTLNLINGVKQLITNSRYPGYSERLETLTIDQQAMDIAYQRYLEEAKNNGTDPRDIVSREEYEARYIRRRQKTLEDEIAGDVMAKYTGMLDQHRMDSFTESVEILATRVGNLLEWLIDYRVRWLQNPHFVAAAQDFCSDDPQDNLNYREIVAFALSMININVAGQALLDRWIAEYSTTSEQNLVWRTLFYNNPQMMAEAEPLLNDLRQPASETVSTDQVNNFFVANAAKLNKLLKGFEKATSAMNSPLSPDAVLSQRVLYRMDQYMASVGARIFSPNGIGRILDSMHNVIVHTLFSLSAGKSVAQIKSFASHYFGWAWERHTYVAGQFFYNPDKAITRSNLKLAHSRFAKLNEAFAEYGRTPKGATAFRATSIKILVTFMNIVEVYNQLEHSKGDAVSIAKITSAALATAGGVVDITMPAMKKAWEGKNGLLYLKMSGAGFAMAASAISLGLDVKSFGKEIQGEKRNIYYGLYLLKLFNDAAVLIKANGKLMEALIARFGWQTFGRPGEIWLGKLAKPGFTALGVEWIGLLASWQAAVLIMLVEYIVTEYVIRDELQQWLKQGIFGTGNTLNTDGIAPEKADAEIARSRESLIDALRKISGPDAKR